jgi:hypothetical protein
MRSEEIVVMRQRNKTEESRLSQEKIHNLQVLNCTFPVLLQILLNQS